ncbi:hypothetical protein Pcinc_025263 [Petrolisthes cinctipes]|uniref:Pro-resilin n=1 Tax=Petrolisthes cinctipes TaxID=88211 RepID=A0AAE1KD96_PETCI|nr:hypothetical protein Pcinc_025263 [Petrolisthes cinctipes]
MNAKTILLLLGVAAMAAGDSFEFGGYGAPRRYSSDSSESFESYESDEAKYNFDWAVRHGPSGNNYGHQEARDNDNTQGSYHVNLPDGRRQTVTYFVDGGSGYIADVKYSGEASFDSGSYESRSSSLDPLSLDRIPMNSLATPLPDPVTTTKESK